ncbi:MAG: hypothetical protein LC725_08055 [Lentisphaerae bacterium]|nr:hypothetical protein [Lentisphaerota bacterium]
MEVSPENVTAGLAELEQEAAAAAAADAAAQPPPASPGGDPGVQANYQEEADNMEWQEILQPLLWGGFKVLAPAWEISAAEAQQLAEAYEPLCAKYMPDGPGKWGPEIAAAFVTVHILAPRMGKPRKLPAPDQEEGEKKPTAHQATPPEKPGDDAQVSSEGMAGLDAA